MNGGNIVFVDKGQGGSDLFLFGRQTRTRRILARTPYFEDEPSVSADNQTVVCTFVDPANDSSGLETVNLTTGKTQTYLTGRFDGITRPVFSPSGLHIAFTHYGRGLDAPFMSLGRSYLCEFDRVTGNVKDVVPPRMYYSIVTPLYVGEDKIMYCGNKKLGEDGSSKEVVATYTRHQDTITEIQPDYCGIQFVAFSRTANVVWALAQKNGQTGRYLASVPLVQFHTASRWRLTPCNENYVIGSPDAREFCFRTEDSHGFLIDSIGTANAHPHTILEIAK